MDKIRISGLEVFANHGVFPEENKLGQKFVVDAILYTDTREAGLSDELTKSIHYGEVSQAITAYMKENTVKLLETVAEGVARHLLLTVPRLNQIDLRISKPWAPVGLPLDTVGVEITRGWHRAFIAMGSNLGDKQAYIRGGIEQLRCDEDIQIIRVSDLIVTKPYGGVEQDDFVNGCMEIRTLLTPDELLDRLQAAEQAANRVRLVHWGPRTLDMDLLFYDDWQIGTDRLSVPHPEIPKRDFVLIPMAQIAPWFVHPVLRKNMGQLLEELKNS